MRVIIIRLALIFLIIVSLPFSSFSGKKGRKLPVGAYLKSAKIEILSGDLERYQTAIYMLDSLFMHYGPHAEGLHLMGQIMVDYIDKTTGITEKKPFISKLVAYDDSLHMCCENKKIKKKYKKDCKKFIPLTDSVIVKYWREFYNNGIEQLNSIDELQEEINNESDSTTIAMIQRDIDAISDSCIKNMELVISIDPEDNRGYVGIGSIYDKKKDYKQAIDWLSKGLEKSDDRSNLLLSIAYDYIKLNEYCNSIPFFKEYVEAHTEDIATMYNLSICYNNCKFYDSAMAINYKILEIDSSNVDVLSSIGRYFNQIARDASDSASFYQKIDNDEQSKLWREQRVTIFDSSLIYFKKIIELKPDDLLALEQYGTISALRGNFEDAAMSFSKLTELLPEEVDYWKYLGDCNINLGQFEGAISAYEKVVEIDPGDVEIWKSLKDLYFEIGDKAKQTDAEKKIKSLN